MPPGTRFTYLFNEILTLHEPTLYVYVNLYVLCIYAAAMISVSMVAVELPCPAMCHIQRKRRHCHREFFQLRFDSTHWFVLIRITVSELIWLKGFDLIWLTISNLIWLILSDLIWLTGYDLIWLTVSDLIMRSDFIWQVMRFFPHVRDYFWLFPTTTRLEFKCPTGAPNCSGSSYQIFHE